MRTAIAWMLIVHSLHVPVPFPDLDGECRGAPILSLSEWHAWHVLLLGVRPQDDIDRGPIRPQNNSQNHGASDTPFGDMGIVTASGAACVLECDSFALPTDLKEHLAPLLGGAIACCQFWERERIPIVPMARDARIRYCSWQV